MRATLLAAVDAGRGVVTRRDALEIVAHHVLDSAVAAEVLVRAFPGVYILGERRSEQEVWRRAAVAAVPGSALSHTDALVLWNLLGDAASGRPSDIHVTTVNDRRHPRPGQGLVVHRRLGFSPDETFLLRPADLPVVGQEQASVESWPLLVPDDRRAAAIVAVRERRTTPARLIATLDEQPRTAGAAEMRRLFDLLRQGCQSELEIWGFEHVFNHPDLPPSRAQVPVQVGRRTYYLDRVFDDEMVNVELDGAGYHFLPGQRERDMARDAALSALGWLTLRFSARLLRADPAGVRRRLLEVLAMRRRQLGLA